MGCDKPSTKAKIAFARPPGWARWTGRAVRSAKWRRSSRPRSCRSIIRPVRVGPMRWPVNGFSGSSARACEVASPWRRLARRGHRRKAHAADGGGHDIYAARRRNLAAARARWAAFHGAHESLPNTAPNQPAALRRPRAGFTHPATSRNPAEVFRCARPMPHASRHS